ncbi:MFS transporter [Phycicoccus sp. MAQZ13P-2]|uniref:MFS transporter n=1 Tax=Phycicoccus mangrovi TaxID=2840470 RepID=UPI001C00209A|nr:MFS transporter [Phycicoccus mangrovi]MBT9254482.1 MFS transporter [Phycicoccus mangrovi]MBT9273313.1 MFS transporter [Phycicoccus mangrovi]
MTTQSEATDAWADTTRYHRPWYWYDWANSAFVTTVGTVLFGPYLTEVATEAACPGLAEDARCTTDLYVVPAAEGLPGWVPGLAMVAAVALLVGLVLSLVAYARDAELPYRPSTLVPPLALATVVLVLTAPLDPGSVAPYTVTLATIASAVLLVFVGAVTDRTPRPARLMGVFAWTGSAAAVLLYFLSGTNWRFGALMMIIASISLGASLVVYDALLCRIARPDDRDRVSSRGWALGYLGGGLLLAVNLVIVSKPELVGATTGTAVRISLLSAGLWWALFTLIPVVGMWNLRGAPRTELADAPRAGIVGGSLSQLGHTFRDLRAYPNTLLFLLAYLFFNDGIQTVISSSSLYGAEQLKFEQSQLIALILLVQFVAFGGALLFGWLAARWGAWRTILRSLVAWSAIVVLAFFLPEKAFLPFLVLGILIGIVLGGSQALSRSLFSQLVPRAREAEFFAFYQAMERGTSWFGALIFGVVHQLTDSYRPAIVALVVFFVLGYLVLRRVDVRQGIMDAGNELPRIV